MALAILRQSALPSLLLVLMGTRTAVAQVGASSPRAEHTDWLDLALHWITRAIEIGGIAIIVVGALVSTFTYLRRRGFGDGKSEEAYHDYRSGLGRSILLGLEFLVAADIIGTVAIEPNLDNLAVLAGIVLIRTFLSFSLEVEIEGRWPWQARNKAPADEQGIVPRRESCTPEPRPPFSPA